MEEAKHALWLRPFGDAAFELKKHIHRLSNEFKTPEFEPHITLLSGLRHSQTELIQFTELLATSLSPFSVELDEPGFHDHYYQALFFQIKQNNILTHIEGLAEKLFGCTTDETYFPHLSLLYGDIPEQKKEQVIEDMPRNMHIHFNIHSVLLIKTEGKVKDWEKIYAAEFKHHKQTD